MILNVHILVRVSVCVCVPLTFTHVKITDSSRNPPKRAVAEP